MTLIDIYDKLLKSFGPQGWWPITRVGKTKPTYHPSNGSRKLTDRERTEIMVGAILTQNTAWTNVEKALEKLHEADLVDIQRLAKVRQPLLATKIRSAGYFNQKSVRLKSFALYLMERYDGDLTHLAEKDLSLLRSELLSLNGVGPETADSMILYAFHKPIFVVDAYTKRIFSRIGLISPKSSYDEVQSFFLKNLKPDARLFNEFHALIVELAKRHCRTKPLCQGCPVKDWCRTGKNA